jgi:hypothetical protein
VALNCTVDPAEADGFAGVTAIDFRTGAMVRVTDVEWLVLPLVPVTVIV